MFIGRLIIRITKNHAAKVEEKPEVKKAGGVFYTPEYIVSYIVQNTIGYQLKSRNLTTIKNYSIVDPACGSGSFLINAYQLLLDWYKKQYTKDPVKYKKQCVPINGNEKSIEFKLTIAERKRILISHIFGVDIDSQAVEVTKLSLLLKALEGLNEQEIQKELFAERALPDLSKNIKCGNSLIGTEFYTQGSFGFTDEDLIKVNCFDWEKEFKEIFNSGGFDAVVGNPPYVSIRTTDFNINLKDYYSKNYKLAIGQYDLYVLFTEKASKILNKNGRYGFIIPKRMTSNENFTDFRKFYLNELPIILYADVGKAFESASVEANIIICSKASKDNIVYIDKKDINNRFYEDNKFNYSTIKEMPFCIFPFSTNLEIINLINKISQNSGFTFGSICEIIRGFECGFNNPLISKTKSKYKIIKGEHISRYKILPTEYYVKPDFKNQSKIFKRKKIFLNTPKLVTKFVSNNLEFAFDDVGYCNTNVVYNIHPKNTDINLFYLLGILNSKLINFWFKNTYVNDDTIFPHIQKNQLESIPLPKYDKVKHDYISSKVIKMIELLGKEINEPNPQQKTIITRQIEAIDAEIDKNVYYLFSLNEKEVRVIENN